MRKERHMRGEGYERERERGRKERERERGIMINYTCLQGVLQLESTELLP